jgi:hypothetical protein
MISLCVLELFLQAVLTKKDSWNFGISLTTACTRPRIALLSCARLARIGIECAAGKAER